MILNRTCNERYQEISWPTKAEPDQVLAVHTFGVHPRFSGRGLGKRMIEEAVKMAADRGMKAIRLDVLEGNLSAEKLYQKVGFQYAGSLNIFLRIQAGRILSCMSTAFQIIRIRGPEKDLQDR